MQSTLRFLLGPPGDFSRLGALAVSGGGAIIGGALYVRQNHLRSSPIVDAAAQQVRSAEAVRALLGGPVASTSGPVGGYTDSVKGTAVVTLPVVSEAGVKAIARAEAEAEWVVAAAEASERGDEPPKADKGPNCRWLLRHLEVALVDAPAAPPPPSSPSAVTLYSVPAHVPLSPWAPSRAPSSLPYWVRALLPNPAAVREDEAAPRVFTVAGVAVVMHVVAFLALRRRMHAEKAIRRTEALLTLPETPALSALRDAAVAAANAVPRAADAAPVQRQAGGVLYGRAKPDEVIGYTALDDNKELFFRAERVAIKRPGGRATGQQQPGSQQKHHEWLLTHLAIEPTVLYSARLEKLPETASAAECLAALQAVQTRPIDLGTVDQRVKGVQDVEAVGAAAAEEERGGR